MSVMQYQYAVIKWVALTSSYPEHSASTSLQPVSDNVHNLLRMFFELKNKTKVLWTILNLENIVIYGPKMYSVVDRRGVGNLYPAVKSLMANITNSISWRDICKLRYYYGTLSRSYHLVKLNTNTIN